MKSPCIDCNFETQDKLFPYIWLPGYEQRSKRKKYKDKTPRGTYYPGQNLHNPCYKCRRAMEYADEVNKKSDINI